MAQARIKVLQKENNLLKTNYFCKVDRRKKVDVALQLATGSCSNTVEFHYVLVIDVSGSMSETYKGSTLSLLDRIKVFADAFVEKLDHRTKLSMVTFSNQATTYMETEKMSDSGQVTAKRIIEKLEVEGRTNLSHGLLTALRTTESRQTRDCIILFTDGEANEGILDANELVDAYQRVERSLGKRVPISAFTIGDYKPLLLHKISTRLGCEAFYWLNEDCNFEADLFAPLVLRQSIVATDITVTLCCIEGVTFSLSDVSTHFLQTDLDSPSSNRELTYFINIIPAAMEKHIWFSLILPSMSEFQPEERTILKVTKSFCDHQGCSKESVDYLELRTKPMMDVSAGVERNSLSERGQGILQNTAAYKMSNNTIDDSWQGAQESFTKVLQEECRMIAVNSFAKTRKISKKSGRVSATTEVQQNFGNAAERIRDLQNDVQLALGQGNRYCDIFHEETNRIKDVMEFAKTKRHNWARLASMESSLASEMPPSSGVFDPKLSRPFATVQFLSELKSNRQTIEERTRYLEDHYGEYRLVNWFEVLGAIVRPIVAVVETVAEVGQAVYDNCEIQ